ncbi:MAG: hypothetical protein ACI9J3_000083 [Parvicellaceae bacterium]|jgi:hypothetical protein
MRLVLLFSVFGLMCSGYALYTTGGFSNPDYTLSSKIYPPFQTEEGAYIPGSGEIVVGKNGIDPISIVNNQVNPIYQSVFWNAAHVRTANKWQAPGLVEELADIYVARSKKGTLISDAVTIYTQFKNRKLHLPVISIATNAAGLFSEEKGIYVQGNEWHNSGLDHLNEAWFDKKGNYSKRGSESERTAFIQFFDADQTELWQAQVGIRINGNATRSFPQKSFRILSKDRKLPGPDGKKRSSLILRNGGNTFTHTIVGDMVVQSMLEKTGMLYQKGYSAVVLLNGTYWGIHNVRDRWKTNDLALKFKTSIDKVAIWEKGEVVNGNPKLGSNLAHLFKLIRSGNADYDQIKEEISLKNFAKYLLFESWAINEDWPNNNYSLYKTGKKKWRFLVTDLDLAFDYGRTGSVNINLFNTLLSSSGEIGQLFQAVIGEVKFKKLLLEEYNHLVEDQVFSAKVFSEKIESNRAILKDEVEHQITRWGKPKSFDEWNENLDAMIEFAVARQNIFEAQVINITSYED